MAADEQTLGIVWAETARLVPFDGSDTTRQRLQAVVGRLVDQARSLGSTANFARPAALPGIAPAPGGERAEAMRQAVSSGIATGKFNGLDLPKRAVLWEVTATGEPRETDARLPRWAEWIKLGPVARTFDFKVDGDSTGRVFRLYESDAEAGVDAISFVSGFTQSGIPRLNQKTSGVSGPWLVGGLATILFFWMIITLGWTGRTVAQARDLMNGSPPEYAATVVKSVLKTCTDSSQPQQPGSNEAQLTFVPACTGPGAPDPQSRNEDGVAQALRNCLVPPKNTPALLSTSLFCRIAWRAAAERANSPEMTTLPWPFGGLLLTVSGWAAKPSGATASISIVLPLIGFWLSIALLGGALGWGTKGSIFGIWINAQNRISLARMQVSLWTITVLGGYAALALLNIGELADSIREFYIKASNGAETLPQAFPDIPAMILAALGISVASPMISSLIKTYSNGPSVDVQDGSMSTDASGIGRFADRSGDGNLEVRPLAAQASLVDLFTGETENDKNRVDVARLQNVVITFILISSYATLLFGFARDIAPTTIVRALDMSAALFPSLPDPGGTFTTLLAASHATYLLSKRAALQT
ncbi:hypothetical protein [Bradyrhizobium sp. HKCCYLS20291]|uniref:hypothetical protein n=1 Tax=Bradyrhizobium sp. HKCCYLS20291 TaxID=3420766 RepID=UPI003EC0489B